MLPIAAACRQQAQAPATETAELSTRIERLVEQFLTSDDEAREQASLAEARAIFEQGGVPSVAKVGDHAAYRFVFINVVGQEPDFQKRFAASVKAAGERHELPEDAVVFAEVVTRQREMAVAYSTRTPSDPGLRDRITALLEADQAVRQKGGFDAQKLYAADQRTAGALQEILVRHGVPTYDMVGIEAAKGFIVMVQHQPAAFRTAVLPKLKANVDAGQADASTFAMVYDRSQRDQGRNQLYGQQLECAADKTLKLAPLDDAAHVDMRRAQLGLMRIDIYEPLVRQGSPDLCGATAPTHP
ncbi:MAG TPA: DUF6624 domain-containing protein [Vicinamibacterales bacterium]|nr:DUF6624 domain-containing protein [Vicinamibacterales bacterium]